MGALARMTEDLSVVSAAGHILLGSRRVRSAPFRSRHWATASLESVSHPSASSVWRTDARRFRGAHAWLAGSGRAAPARPRRRVRVAGFDLTRHEVLGLVGK